MLHLLIGLFERLGIFAIAFILMMRFGVMRRLLTGRSTPREKLFLSVLFGVFGIGLTYAGIPIQGAIVNSRVVAVALGGILGGPLVGLLAGLIAGVHRYLIDIGGFTAMTCCVTTIVEGVVGGIIYHALKRRPFDTRAAFLTGVAAEVVQMGLVLVLAKPFDAAWNLVTFIALPMILVNSSGLAMFMELISSVSREQERVGAYQAQTALNIAFRTLPILRAGLNSDSASDTARIILDMTDLDAVAITNDANILAHKGVGVDHHVAGNPLMTASTKLALSLGTIQAPMTKQEIGCRNDGCRLGSAIVVPLKRREKTMGALKLYRMKERGIGPLDMELAKGLAHLFSNQLELAEMEEQRKLLADAEIRALQAQIHPHFLFNAINTIVSYMRTNPTVATDLLVRLSEFLRKNIDPGSGNVPLSTELEHCMAYVAIESARFEDRINVIQEIDPGVLSCRIPSLTLQPLVENAFKHGILPKEEGGEVVLGAHIDNGAVKLFVKDNGVGMTSSRIASLFSKKPSEGFGNGSGIALKNINARLMALYGQGHGLSVESEPNRWTTVSFTIPQVEYEHQSLPGG